MIGEILRPSPRLSLPELYRMIRPLPGPCLECLLRGISSTDHMAATFRSFLRTLR